MTDMGKDSLYSLILKLKIVFHHTSVYFLILMVVGVLNPVLP